MANAEDVANKNENFYVYIIGRREVGPWKVGITKNPRWRIMDLQSCSPDPLVIHSVVRFGDRRTAEIVERQTHQSFLANHSHGEWFTGPIEDILFVLKEYADCNKGIFCDATVFTQKEIRVRGSSATYKYRDAEKRKTYQRDLMRKRRGAGK